MIMSRRLWKTEKSSIVRRTLLLACSSLGLFMDSSINRGVRGLFRTAHNDAVYSCHDTTCGVVCWPAVIWCPALPPTTKSITAPRAANADERETAPCQTSPAAVLEWTTRGRPSDRRCELFKSWASAPVDCEQRDWRVIDSCWSRTTSFVLPFISRRRRRQAVPSSPVVQVRYEFSASSCDWELTLQWAQYHIE